MCWKIASEGEIKIKGAAEVQKQTGGGIKFGQWKYDLMKIFQDSIFSIIFQ